MGRRQLGLIAVVAVIALWLWTQRTDPGALHAPAPPGAPSPGATSVQLPAFLPPEAHDVLARIARGGPYEHRQDGSVFQNRERRLPPQPRGYYREYTVETPGEGDRGARRIITGGDPPAEYWYTDDHYRSFRRFDVPARPTP